MYAPLNTSPTTGFRPGVQLAGVGYVAGGGGPRGGNQGWNPTLGYSRLSGLGWLGDISSENFDQLVEDGCVASDVQLAVSLGMTDAQAAQILSLNDSDAEEQALLQLIGTLNAPGTMQTVTQIPLSETNPFGGTLTPATPPSSAAPVATPAMPAAPAPATIPVAQASAAAPQSPSGSTLLYTCNYNVNTYVPGGSLLVTPTNLISQLNAKLAGTGLSISGTPSTSYSGNSFTVSVLDSVGHALLTDAKSVLDSIVNSLSGVTVVSSTISLGSAGSGAGATDITTWLENNALTIGLVVAAIFVAPALINSFKK